MASLKRLKVGVIGAGVAGLQMARALRARGIDCKVFDKAPAVGGLWRENYHGYGVQVPKQLYEFPDYPNSLCEWGEFPTGENTQAYIQSYAKAFDLNSSVVLNTMVDKLSRPGCGRGWTFHTTTTTDGTAEQHDFDYAVIASGMYSAPKNMPALPGRNAFERAGGTVLHSSEYLDPKVCRGKNVVVLGGGKSAIDIAVDSATAGQSAASTLLFRNAHWGTPRKIAGLVPFQYVFLSRFGQSLVSWFKGAWPGAPGVTHAMHRILAAPMRSVFSIVEALFAYQLGHHGKLRPAEDVVRDFYGYAQVLEPTFAKMVSSGAIAAEQGEVARLDAGNVVIATSDRGERSVPCDVCVCATGFSKSYDYLPPTDAAALGVESDGLYLYRHIFPPGVADLAFCGSEVATISNIMTHSIHAEYIARVVGGELALPPTEEQRADIEATKAWKRQWMLHTPSRASLVLLHQTHYHDQLMTDLGLDVSRKGNLLATLFMPYGPSDYDGVIAAPRAEPAPAT